MTDFKFYTPPKHVGWWVMPGSVSSCETRFAAYKKPSWLHRKTMLWVFGWSWRDEA